MNTGQKMLRSVAEYLALPYTFKVRRDDRDEVFVARIEELPGCSAHGATAEEAIANLRDNMKDWIEDALDSGDSVPLPAEEVGLPSGKWVQRVPRTLHLKLTHLAKQEGVSLNQLVTSALAEAVGAKSNQPHPTQSADTYAVYVNRAFAPAQFPTATIYDIRNEVGFPITVAPIPALFSGVFGCAETQLKFETGQERRKSHAKGQKQSFAHHS